MRNFNFTIIEGNLTKNPEHSSDAAMPEKVTMEVLSRRSYTKQDGEKVEQDNTFKIIAEGKLAQVCIKYLKKGSRILVSGELLPSGEIYTKEVNFLSPTK